MYIREKYLEELIRYKDTEFIKILTGVRRSGKSYILEMFKQHLLKSGIHDEFIINLNFENLELGKLLTYEALYGYLKERITKKQKYYVLFDEIQMVGNWQRLINGLRISFDCDIYITGSNADLLSGELATHLSGRYVEIKVFPFSFKEYCEFKGIVEAPNELHFDDYMKYGGFPSIIPFDDKKLVQNVLLGIYNSIILKDVSLRGGISNIDLLLSVMNFLFDNIGQSISCNNIVNYLISKGRKARNEIVEKYLSLLENSFIFYKVKRYDIRGKEYLKTLGKYYAVDTGLRSAVLGRQDINQGSIVENIVYIELVRRGYKVFVGKYETNEIDFVCLGSDETLYIQVTQQLPSGPREQTPLLKIKGGYKKMIITNNRMDVGVVDGIPVIHIVDFLLKV